MTIRAILAALLAVLTLASSASAECAWVLWMWNAGPGEWWTPKEAFESRDGCMKAKEHELDLARAASPIGLLDIRCLPDTVDPRAPKGSGR